ncbi:Na/Pi cotransporter family protein [Candidatus Woesearchaeota archaeon]|nr:Na/Pi cotransporter family protein [Candidatus Woesearchaeota archaeon]
MSIFNIILLILGGLALFIYGVKLLSDSLVKVAGSKLEKLLDKMTTQPLKGALFGATATAMLQSSSLLMVTVIGLVNANLLTLSQAINIILGQEIGTTLTGQLISFNLGSYFFLFIVIGFIFMFFTKSSKAQHIGGILFAFGLIFMGMIFIAQGSETFSGYPFYTTMLITLGRNLYLAILAGILFTAIFQSSSAMTALVIAMGSAGTITLPVAIAFIFGANIGTCITGWFASLNSSVNAKRTSYAQILINIGGVLLFLPFIHQFAGVIQLTSHSLPRQIANAHTIFNICVSIIMFPLVKPLAAMLMRIVPGSVKVSSSRTKYIDDNQLKTPVIALVEAKKEIIALAKLANKMLEEAREAFIYRDINSAKRALAKERTIDKLAETIEHFLDKIAVEKLHEKRASTLKLMKNSLIDIERIGDLTNNVAEFSVQMIDEKIIISKTAIKELDELFNTTIRACKLAAKSLDTDSKLLAKQVYIIEQEVDDLENKFKNNHMRRMEKKICSPKADTIFVETLRNLERISDHAFTIASHIIYL